jgi:hypothetical protein
MEGFMTFKRFYILILFFNIIFFSIGGYAQNEEKNEDYNKIFSISSDPISHMLIGYNATVEYTGLGAIGIYGSYLYVNPNSIMGQVAEDIDTDISGYGVNAGLRYYYDYEERYHDSKYVAAEVQYAEMKFEYNSDSFYTGSLDASVVGVVLYHGWRWQWSYIFCDFSLGAGYMTTNINISGEFTNEDKTDIEDATTGYTYGLRFAVGVAF